MSRAMEIVCLNAWGGALFEELAAWLHGSLADVYCFQEVTHTPGITGWTRYDDPDRSLPQRANLFADLAAALPEHRGHFAASDTGPVTATDGRTHSQHFGLATFIHRRLAVLESTERFVHGEYAIHEAWPNRGRPRVAHTVRVRVGRRTVVLTHFHGLRDPAGKIDTPERRAQSQRLAELVSETRKPDDFAVICGDFNLLPSSETFQRLSEIGFTDLVGTADTRTSHYLKPVRHADYLLVSHSGQVRDFEIRSRPEVSDHRILALQL